PRGRSPSQSLFVLLGRNNPFSFSGCVLSTTHSDTASSPSTQRDHPSRPPQAAMTSTHHPIPFPNFRNSSGKLFRSHRVPYIVRDHTPHTLEHNTMPLVAGIDSSTQSCKIVVCDAETGTLVREARAAHPDGTEVHPHAWWRAL